ncbi:ABC transporter permease [Paenibacillus sp. FSL H8-0034]|uniref:ABC transporter permease n=1 Tax=Paenibacillus sp. FSL H8-0034 TaxID=2954671 RepID=UPI0030F88DDD
MFLPGLLYFILFKYVPMAGIVVAFQDYNFVQGILGSDWVGFRHFERLLADPMFARVLRNTVLISMYRLALEFPAPIVFALLLNELRKSVFKRWVQTISYLPHFISWVVIAGLLNVFFSPSYGIVNWVLQLAGVKPIFFMASQEWFVPILIMSNIWKELGWEAVVYLAALSGIDASLYEAAEMDGASKWRQTVAITLPSIAPVIAVMLILRVGHILDAGFDQVFNLYSPTVYEVGDILDTFVYRLTMVDMDYSFGAAVGLFKSGVGLLMIVIVNGVIRRLTRGEQGVW